MTQPTSQTIPVNVVHLEFVQGSSDKFYRVFTIADEITCQYGRNGTYGSFTPRKPASDADAARAAADKAIAAKIAKGYVITRAATHDFDRSPTDAALDAWANTARPGDPSPVAVPHAREQAPAVAALAEEPTDPGVMPRVLAALAALHPTQAAETAPSTGTASAPLAMLAHNADPADLSRLLADPAWVVQTKLDGDRLLVEVRDGEVRAYGRNGQAKASNVGRAMLAPFRHLTLGRWVFDGEVMGRTLWLFDLPVAEGHLDRSAAFSDRHAALDAIVQSLPSPAAAVDAPLRLVPFVTGETAKRQALRAAETGRKEGVMFRRAAAAYRVGRSLDLLKHKFVKTLDAVVVGVGGRGTVTTYTATFTPQSWISDYAVDVDPEGESTWTVGADHTGDAARIVAADADGLDNDDVLKGDPAAPAWVRDWSGPFSIHVSAETRNGGKQSAALAVYDHDGAEVEVGNVTTIGKGGPGGIQVGQVVEVAFLYVVNPEHPVLYQPRILRVRTDKAAAECSTDQLIGTHTDRTV